jgi:tRNA (uracil-5-)-methyltransferase TRM9
MKPETAKSYLQQTRLAYNAVADDFSRTRARPWPALDVFNDYIKEGDRVLDIGCGNGRLLTVIGGKKIDYLGIDNSEPLIEIARHNYPKRAFQVGDLIKLELDNQAFDIVLLVAVLHHIPSVELRRQALGQIHQVLKPGGYLLMTNWNLWHPNFWRYHLKYTFQRITGKQDLDPGDILRPWGNTGEYRYFHTFTKNELLKMADKSGFKVEKNYYTKRDGSPGFWWSGINFMSIWRRY